VVIRTTAKTDLVRAIAYLTWPALAAPLIAPALGGVLSTYASWRLIFLINLPLGVVALLVALRLVPDVRSSPGPLDWRGFLLSAVSITALVVAMESVGSPRIAIVAAILASAGLAATIRYLRRAPNPLLTLRDLGIRTYRATAFGGSVFRAVITAIPFLLPLFFQLGFGWSAARSGVVIIALFAGNIGIKPVTTPLLRHFGMRTVMVGAVAASAVCLIGMAFLRSTTPAMLLIVLLVSSGVFRSVGFTAYNTLAFADVPTERMTGANTLMSTVQELAAGLGVAVAALLVRVGGTVTHGGAGPYRVAFAVLAVMLAVPMIEAIALPHTAGNLVAGRR
jgi:MFS family permease